MLLRLLVDAERLVGDWLRTHPDITAIVGTRVGTELTAVRPCVKYQRLGGIPQRAMWLDRARIQVEAYASNRGGARDLAARCQAALHDMPSATHALGVVSGVEDDMGLTWSPDPDLQDAPRFLFAVLVYLHPLP